MDKGGISTQVLSRIAWEIHSTLNSPLWKRKDVVYYNDMM